jgi:apolipoprotein N-acyltransferase
MASAASSLRTSAIALLAIVPSAVLYWFGNSLDPLWPLMWIAPLPILIFAVRPSSSWYAAALVAFFGFFCGCLTLWHYFRVFQLPALVFIEIFSAASLGFTLAVLLFRALLRRGHAWAALLAFPATWTSVEFLHSILTLDGTAGSLAYTQLKFLPFLQLASVTGPWGITFLLLLFPAAIAIGLHLRLSAPHRALRILATSFGIIAIVIIAGVIRLARPAPGPLVTVGLLASDTPANSNVADPGEATQIRLRSYAGQASLLAGRGATIIVLPEHLGELSDNANADPAFSSSAADAIFQPIADSTRATIIVGLAHRSPNDDRNQARIYSPESPVASYNKQHLLPPWETRFLPGSSLTFLPHSAGNIGVAICKDMDFAAPARSYGSAGTGLLLDPAWDFRLDRGWHGHIAIMRGVEDGFSIAHTARNGYLTVSDSRGRILAETRSDSAPFATLIAQVPVTHVATLYVIFGNWFAWLALVLVAVTLIRLR